MTVTRSQLPAFVNGLGAATDTALVSAVPGNRIRVIAGYVSAGAATSTVQFNSKGSGAGTACAGLINLPINGFAPVPGPAGEFQTGVGEGLTVTTTGTGPASVNVTYILVPDNTPANSGMPKS